MDILELRKRLHEMLDPLWQTGQYRRDDLYQELSSLLKKDAHVSRINVCHMCFTCLSVHRSPWRVSAIEQESELLGHLNG